MINGIIEEYSSRGYSLTLRQLYYQLVSRAIVANKLAEYKKLSNLLKEGRMGGIVDWDAIEDRLRVPYTPFNIGGPDEAMKTLISQYALNRQEGQECYMEVWVEKDALSGVLKRVTSKYHVPIMVNRGYSSVTAMFDSYERFRDAIVKKDQVVNLLYLGDFDPSGLDMVRDIKTRTIEFMLASVECRDYFKGQIENITELREYYGEQVVEYAAVNELVVEDEHHAFEMMYMIWLEDRIKVKPIALSMAQIEKYNPPPNPAKVTDPRAKEYIEKYGPVSWEVDALNPDVLHELLERSIQSHLNMDTYNAVLEAEKADKAKLEAARKSLK